LAGRLPALIPMLFYDFSGEKRKRVMQELQLMRALRLKKEESSDSG